MARTFSNRKMIGLRSERSPHPSVFICVYEWPSECGRQLTTLQAQKPARLRPHVIYLICQLMPGIEQLHLDMRIAALEFH